jgi:hypothetical protein
MPMIEKIVHTAKQTVNAIVDIQSARPCVLDAWPAVSSVLINCSRKHSDANVRAKTKKLPAKPPRFQAR